MSTKYKNLIHPALRDADVKETVTVEEANPPPKLGDLPLPAPFDDKPVVKSIGLAKVKGGWCVVAIKSQGNVILDNEVVSGPDPKPVAVERLKIHIVRNLFITGDAV